MSRFAPIALLFWLLTANLSAQTPGIEDAKEKDAPDSGASAGFGSFDLFGGSNLTETSENLVEASASMERFGDSLEAVSATLIDGLARMSSGFDPLGYQGAFRTIAEQTEVIKDQQVLIYELQQREIDRLKQENEQLRRRLAKHRQQKRAESHKTPRRGRGR